MTAPLPPRERQRLEALKAFGILDTPPEPEFDEITALAAGICRAPIALISLVDGSRQWFKSRVGLDPGWTPRDVAFCAHALAGTDLLIVPDAAADPRFSDNPLVTGEPRIRFYAGAPLVTSAGDVLGTLCVLDRVPRALDEHQKLVLLLMARQVMARLHLRREVGEARRAEAALLGMMEDQAITARTLRQSERIQACEARILEAVSSGRPMAKILELVMRGVEEDLSGGIASILSVDAAGRCLRTWVAPGLPDEFLRAIAGVPVGPGSGSCGTAAHRRETVVVSDIEADPLWADFRDLARRFGLRACWSVPVMGDDGTVQATFAVYFREPRSPQGGEIPVLARMANVVRIAMERDRRETDLRRSEARFAGLFRASPAAIAISSTAEGRYIDINDRCCQLSGYSREEVIGKTSTDLALWIDPVDRVQLLAQLRAKGALMGLETRFRRKDGEIRDVILSMEQIDLAGETEPVLVSQFFDVTERREAERQVRQGQALLRMASRVNRLGAWQFDLATRGVVWSEEVRALHEVPLDYVPTAESSIAFYIPEHRELVRAAVSACAREGTPFDRELQIVSATGRRVGVRAIGEAVRDATGTILQVQGTFQDITERKLSEERIAEQAALIDAARDGIIVRDLDHVVTFWSKGAERVYGWTAAEALGKRKFELLHEDLERFQQADRIVREAGAWNGEIQMASKSGSRLVIDCRWTLLRDPEGRPKSILAIGTDITERKKLEQQFLRAQRMESIGTLAGGIAHDLNNVLAPILMSIELLRLDLDADERQQILDTIEASARRGADMVSQVLSFARGVEGRRLLLQVRHLIRDVAKIAKETFPREIEIRTLVPSDLHPVTGDPTQIHQVLLNLCVNARDAMPLGGTLTLSAQNLVIDAHCSGLSVEARPGPYVAIEVEDTGTGIPPELVERIFDPFFTTKGPGKGTGLGLSTSMAIVRSHAGYIQVYSEPGKGSRFRVYLPSTTGSTALEEVREPDLPRGNGELVLLVDDEASVRQITRQTLEAFGYRVVFACDGAEAVAIYAARKDEIAVVLTDMMMPVMDGPATILVILRLNPVARIIAASGLDAGDRLSRVVSAGIRHFLPKPYNAETLLKAMKEILQPPVTAAGSPKPELGGSTA